MNSHEHDDDIIEGEKQRKKEELERLKREAEEEARRAREKEIDEELIKEIIKEQREIEEAREEIEKMREDLKRGRQTTKKEEFETKTNNAFRLVIKRISEVNQGKLKPKTPQGEKFVRDLAAKGVLDRLNTYNAPYIYPLIEKMILLDNPDLLLGELVEGFERLNKNSFLDQDLMRSLAKVCSDTAKEIAPNLNPFELSKRFNPSEKHFQSSTDPVLYEMIEELGEDYAEFFEGIMSSKNFVEYAKRKQEQIREELKKENPGFDNLPEAKKRQLIADKFTKYIKSKISTIIFKIYGISDLHQNEAFDHIEKHGVFMLTPSDFYLSFTHRLEELKDHFSYNDDLIVSIPKFIEKREVDKDTGRELRPKVLLNEKEYLNLKDGYSASNFFENLYQYATSEKERLSFGHNIRYLIKVGSHSPDVQEKGFFKMLQNFSNHLNSSYIDEIFLEDELNEVVMSAMNIFERSLERTLSKNQWQGDPKLLETIFASLSSYEREMLDEFVKRYGGKYSLEEIRRAIYNAQIMFLGVNYQALHYFSFVEPENPITIGGYGEIMMSFYNQGSSIQRRFGGDSLIAGGADYMPINYFIENFDHRDWKKWKKAYEDSFKMGRAAFFPLILGDDWQTVRLAINPGNIGEAGGFAYLARWRMFNAYKYYLMEAGVLNSDSESLDTKKFGENIYQITWKALENLGIDVLKNFAVDKFVLGSLVDSLGKPQEKNINGFINLFDYLYDRYYSREFVNSKGERFKIGQYFLPESIKTKEDFIKYLKERLSSKYPGSVIKGFAKGLIYDTFTMMLIERSPSKLLTLEKPMFTQNGERLWDEIRNSLGLSIEGMDEAIKDLQYVETELRTRTIKEMLELKEKRGNAYGDLNSSRSEIDFILDERKIERYLREFYQLKGLSENEINLRIRNVISAYRSIYEQASDKPVKAKWEQGLDSQIREKKEKLKEEKKKFLKDKKSIKKLEEEIFQLEKMSEVRSQFMSRFRWFSKMWREDEWGMSITSGDNAYAFLRFSADGPELMTRVAGFNFDVAETPAKVWAGGFTEALRQARASHSLEPVYKVMDQVYKAAAGQWGEGPQASKCVMPFLKRMGYYFRRDERRGDPLSIKIGKLKIPIPFSRNANLRKLIDFFTTSRSHELENLSYSFSQQDAGGWRAGNIYDFGPDDLTEISRAIIGGRGIKYMDYEPGAADIPYKLITVGEKHPLIGRLAKRIPFFKKLADKVITKRDYGREVSAQAVKFNGGFSWDKFWKLEISPRLILIFLIITLILLGKSAKEDLKLGAK